MTMIAGGGVLEIVSPLGQWSLATGERTTRRMWSSRIPADPLDMEGEAAAAVAALSRCLSSTEWIPEDRRRVRSVQGRWRALSGEGWHRSCSRCGATGGGARDSWRPRLLCSSSESGRLAGARGAGRRRPTRAQLRRWTELLREGSRHLNRAGGSIIITE